MATTQKTPHKADKTITNAVCPFCSLLCDDLSLKSSASGLKLLRNTCPNAINGFERLSHEYAPPNVSGHETKLRDAIAESAQIIANSARPVFGGLGTDVDALRTLYKLAGQCGATIDHMHSQSALANIGVMQTLGWYTTTLSEVKNRADIVLIVGADCKNQYARFVEKTLEPSSAIASAARRNRQVIYLGPRKNAPRSKKIPIDIIACEQAEIATLLSILGAHVHNKALQSSLPQNKKLADLATKLSAADYANIVWSAGSLESSQARLCIETISRMVATLNESTRAAGLSLGGDEGGMSAQQVSSWLSGFPVRVSYSAGIPEYNPRDNQLSSLIAAQALDCLVWVDAFGRSTPPDLPADVPLIYIGHPSLATQLKAHVSIPVGMPGIHHKARLVRTDSVVTVPLDRTYGSKLPSVKSVADSLATAISTLTDSSRP